MVMFVGLLQRGGLRTEKKGTQLMQHTHFQGETWAELRKQAEYLGERRDTALTEIGFKGWVRDGDLELEQGEVQEVSLDREEDADDFGQ